MKRARAQLLDVENDRALDSVRFNILASLRRLPLICCHPALFNPAYRDTPKAKLEACSNASKNFAPRAPGPRLQSVRRDIGNHPPPARRRGHSQLMLAGKTNNRAGLVEKFQTDLTQTVFLLSFKTAGFGLNLTAASYAILYDPRWNPAVETQATAPAHRIVQTQPVVAYRLLESDTIEEKIRRLHRAKAALASAVVQEESLARVLDLDRLESLHRIFA